MADEIKIVTDNPNVSHWSIDTGYTSKVHESVYPLRIFNRKENGGLSAFPTLIKRDIDYVCGGQHLGFNVFLSTPGESLKLDQQIIRVPVQHQVSLFVRSKIYTTSENVRDFDAQKRGCFYSSERQLRYFKYYTQNNCEIECLTNFTLNECGCVKFYMPSIGLFVLNRAAQRTC